MKLRKLLIAAFGLVLVAGFTLPANASSRHHHHHHHSKHYGHHGHQ
jgi:hypothetical protein